MPHKFSWMPPRLWSMAIPFLLGVLACVLVTGGTMLWPGNVYWLTHGDLAQSYLGWAFYRDAPWALPPGANPGYGLGLHASIYYSDSIPLLAMLFKPLAAWLPQPFQYFGLWVLACFVLQAGFAWRLLGLVTPQLWSRALGVLFFVLAPPMLMRLGGHMALVGHWLLLAAIYLCLRRSRRHQSACWALLAAAAMVTHAYLFAMVGAVWLADIVHRHRLTRAEAPIGLRAGIRRWLPEVSLVVVATVMAAWLAGFFMVSGHGMQASGFGYYKMNLLALVNGDGWSGFGLKLPQGAGEYEGFNYLGLGGIVLVGMALLAAVMHRDLLRERMLPRPLLLVASGLTVLAITCNVGIGAIQWRMPMPDGLWLKLSHLSLQSTGRMFWVPYYLLLLAGLFTVLRVFHGRWQIGILLLAATLQLMDLYPGLSGLRSTLLQRSRDTNAAGLRGPFWDAAGTHYRVLRQLPPALMAPGWEQLASYAQRHRMGTDAVMLARFDWNRFLSLHNDQQAALLGGQPDQNTLYLLNDREVALARVAVPATTAALFRLDGRNVLAPGWQGAIPSSAVDLRRAEASSSLFRLPFRGDFVQDGVGRLLLGPGWNSAGAGEVSTLGVKASLFVPAVDAAGLAVHVGLGLHRASSRKDMAQRLEVWADGRLIGDCELAGGSCGELQLDVPDDRRGASFRELSLRSGQPSARLSVALDTITVTLHPPVASAALASERR
ncbi:DUF6311 domain-containing protein [Rhodanobacter denitrificans]|nr:DUF6311 domain-containing protein [Rhodanobacter denitrificans]